jgi:hypothetical protein
MKRILTYLFLCMSVAGIHAQNVSKADTHASGQAVFIRIEGNQNGWTRGDNESSQGTTSPVSGTENVSFNGTSDGIYITINSGTNKIKLFALTGQLLLDGDLTQGRFFIPTRKGIYFLKINNKSFKVICK